MLRESLKRELATGRDADYTRALTRAVNDFLQAFPHTKRTCSAIRQAARSLAAAQRESQGGHGREEGAVVAARSSLPQAAQAQTDHHAARGTSDQEPGSNGAASRAPQSKDGSRAAQDSYAAALPEAAAGDTQAAASSLAVCAPASSLAAREQAAAEGFTGSSAVPPSPQHASRSDRGGGATASQALGSTSSKTTGAASATHFPSGRSALPERTREASRARLDFPNSFPDEAEQARAAFGATAFPKPVGGARVPRVSTRCPTSSGRPGAPSPEPRSTSTSTGVASSPTFPNWSSIGSGGGWSGPYRPFDLTRCGVPTIKTHFPPRSRASPAPKRARLSAEPEEMSSSLHVGIMNHCDDDVQFVECPPNRHIAVYTPYCVKITRDPPPSSGIPSFGRICKPIFALRGGEAGNYHTVQMPDDVEMSAKTISAKQIARSDVVVAMDTIFRSAANNLSVVLRLEVRRVVRSDGREGR